MAEMIHSEIVLESANKQVRYKLFVTDDGKLATLRLFHKEDGSWKPKGSDAKVLAIFNSEGHFFYLNRDWFHPPP
jgi:hypothetical protein